MSKGLITFFKTLAFPIAAALGASGQAASVADTVHLTFGVYQTDKATTTYRQFTPILEALQSSMEADLARPVDIELRIYRTYDGGIDALVQGEVDFVRFGPASYITARGQNEAIRLLAMEHKHGKKRFPGAIVVRADSDIRSLEDLRGRSFAFGDANSTIGRYLSQALLVDGGIRASDLANHRFLGRHDLVAKAVEVGDVDAGALKLSTLRKVDRDKQLRVLVEFENVTKPWIARAGLPEAVERSLRHSLLEVSDEDALVSLKVSGFLPTSDAEYSMIRERMRLAREFDAVR